MKNNNLQIKRDIIGIMPIDAKKRIIYDIKKMILSKKLSEPESKQQFDEYVKTNPELLAVLQDVAFNQLVKKIADKCEEFNTSEYLIDKYQLDDNNSSKYYAKLYPLAIKVVRDYLDIDGLTRKYDMYYSLLSLEVEELNSKVDEKNDTYSHRLLTAIENSCDEAQIDSKEQDDDEEQIKIVDRVSKLESDMDEIETFTYDTDGYADGLIDNFEDKLISYMYNNASSYVDINRLFARLINDLENLSMGSRMIYLSTISDYVKKYKMDNKNVNNPESKTR